MILYPQEIWKRVSKYVEVSSFGRKRVKGEIVEVLIDPSGYYGHKLHRFVAKAFVPNPFNKPQVHHKDGDRTNNHISNLMWVTHRENQVDPIRRERVSKSLLGKPRLDLSKQIRVWNDIGYSQTFSSVGEASKTLNVGNLSAVALGKRKQSKGYYAEYI